MGMKLVLAVMDMFMYNNNSMLKYFEISSLQFFTKIECIRRIPCLKLYKKGFLHAVCDRLHVKLSIVNFIYF